MKNQVLIAALCVAVSNSVFAQKQNWEWAVEVPFYFGHSFSKDLPYTEYSPDGKNWGFIFSNGKKTPPIFRPERGHSWSSLPPKFQEGIAIVRGMEDDSYGAIDDQGNVLITPRFTRLGNFSDGIAPALEKRGDKIGYIDTKGNWVIAPRFLWNPFRGLWYNEFSEGLAAQTDPATEKIGYIDRSGNWVIQPQYDEAQPFSQGLAGVSKNGRFGAIDKTGKVVIPITHDFEIRQFNEQGWAITHRGAFGAIDKTGKVLFAPQFKTMEKLSNGWYRVEKSLRYGYLDANAKMILPVKYGPGEEFSEGLARIDVYDKSEQRKAGFMDETGKIVIPAQFYADRGVFKEGFAVVNDFNAPEGANLGYINKQGAWIARPQFKYAENFSEGLAAVTLPNGKRGFIDQTGKLAIPAEYYYVHSFHGGIAVVQPTQDGDYGAIDKTGKLVIPVQFKTLGDFHQGLAPAELNNRTGYIRYKKP